MKVLIYIVCYNDEKHIRGLLSRIPSQYRCSSDIKVVISDDCSSDNTSIAALEACRELGYTNFEVFRTKINQGYGGNQKIGYNYACGSDFDYVILLQGNGQYAPEELPNFFSLFETGADVVIGSRMIAKTNALKGNMRLYKFLADLALAKTQNALAGTGLSGFHTGYRGYSTAFLKEAPFELNSNDYDFDTDILLQAVFLEKDIREFPIRTFYGDEARHIDLFGYGLNILRTSLKFRMQQLGIGCSLKFRGSKNAVYKNKFMFKYSSHYHLLELIKRYRPKKIIDIGAGGGHLGEMLKDSNVHITGIDVNSSGHPNYQEFYREDIESFDFSRISGAPFDMVCLMDVLEHLKEPELLLLKMRSSPLFENAVFVISIPNVAFFSIRIGLFFFGRFNYSDRGILDISHKRLFTCSSLEEMLMECGYKIKETIPVPPPFHLLRSGRVATFLTTVFNLMNMALPGPFSFQIMKVAAPIATSTIIIERFLEKYD